MKKMSGESLNLVDVNIKKIKQVLPECVTDGIIDYDKLKLALGVDVNLEEERYSFTWNGKSDSTKNALTPSTSTLRPDIDSSVNWNKTNNLYIEGDNLEVLKTLLKTYHNKIKMIYIDPPYNTGKDFVYRDNFTGNVNSYLQQTNQNYRVLHETSGRYHTDWLNMMNSRIRLAKNLLSDDGIIFFSIDDNEQANLTKLCNEIFGENNFICCFPRITKKGGKSTGTYAKNHDYILVFANDINSLIIKGIGHVDEGFKNKDQYYNERGPYKLNQTLDYNSLQYNKSMDYVIELEGKQYVPGGNVENHRNRHNGIHGAHDWVWRWSKQLFDFGLKNGWIEISKTGRIYTKTYLNASIEKNESGEYYIEYNVRTKPLSTLEFIESKYSNDNSNKELSSIMGCTLFDYVKPTSLIMQLMRTCTEKDSLIMDFFSGSATTADAVMQLNAEDGGKRQYILVQLPEKCGEGTEALKAGFETICDIGEERIRRAGKKIYDELKQKKESVGLIDDDVVDPDSLDLGFKVFKLDSTCIKPWDSTIKYDENSVFELNDVIKEDRTNLDVAYEVMLKYGVFNMPLEEITVNNKTVYSVGKGYMIISLNDEITSADVESIAKLQPKAVVFKESGFANDNAKMNADYTFKRLGIENVKCI